MRRSVCDVKRGGCGQEIEWGQLFGKRHPFNLDGTSHFDTCPKAHNFRGGLRTLGDRDTFYRDRWCERFLGEGLGFDRSLLTVCPLPWKVAMRLGEALYYVGGPLHSADWEPPVIAQCCYAGGADANLGLVAVSVDKAILFRLRDYLGESDFREVYSVAGLYLVLGHSDQVCREEGWK